MSIVLGQTWQKKRSSSLLNQRHTEWDEVCASVSRGVKGPVLLVWYIAREKPVFLLAALPKTRFNGNGECWTYWGSKRLDSRWMIVHKRNKTSWLHWSRKKMCLCLLHDNTYGVLMNSPGKISFSTSLTYFNIMWDLCLRQLFPVNRFTLECNEKSCYINAYMQKLFIDQVGSGDISRSFITNTLLQTPRHFA